MGDFWHLSLQVNFQALMVTWGEGTRKEFKRKLKIVNGKAKYKCEFPAIGASDLNEYSQMEASVSKMSVEECGVCHG